MNREIFDFFKADLQGQGSAPLKTASKYHFGQLYADETAPIEMKLDLRG